MRLTRPVRPRASRSSSSRTSATPTTRGTIWTACALTAAKSASCSRRSAARPRTRCATVNGACLCSFSLSLFHRWGKGAIARPLEKTNSLRTNVVDGVCTTKQRASARRRRPPLALALGVTAPPWWPRTLPFPFARPSPCPAPRIPLALAGQRARPFARQVPLALGLARSGCGPFSSALARPFALGLGAPLALPASLAVASPLGLPAPVELAGGALAVAIPVARPFAGPVVLPATGGPPLAVRLAPPRGRRGNA